MKIASRPCPKGQRSGRLVCQGFMQLVEALKRLRNVINFYITLTCRPQLDRRRPPALPPPATREKKLQ